MKRNEILRIYGTDHQEMTERLLEEASLAEHIGGRRRIGIKPNLVTCSPAQYGATTHPEIVEGIVSYLKRYGIDDITVLEGSWVGDDTEQAFTFCGMREIAGRHGIKLINTKKCRAFSVGAGPLRLNISECLKDIDFLINVPVLKGHCQTKMTCALKNMKGLIPDSEKRRFHTLGLHEPIAYLNTVIKQDFIVVDNICGDPYFEEGGNPLEKNRILCGLDPVLIDSYAIRELGLKDGAVRYVALAEGLGVGTSAGGEIRDIGENAAPSGSKHMPGLDVSYAIDDADTCSACYAQLTGALIRLEREGILEKLPVKIGIGQGMRGKGGAFGVGNCTSCFDRFVRGCPPSEEDIYREIKNVISGL